MVQHVMGRALPGTCIYRVVTIPRTIGILSRKRAIKHILNPFYVSSTFKLLRRYLRFNDIAHRTYVKKATLLYT